MTRQLFFAITLVGTGMLLNARAEAVSPLQCEDRVANCIGGCAIYTGGAGDVGGRQNICLRKCDQQVVKCLVRAVNSR